MSILQISGLNVSIGQYAVLHDMSFEVDEGGVFVLLGRNGAGKTTTLRAIMGLWERPAGSIRFRGEDISGLHTSEIAQRGIAYVPENMGIFGGLTVCENMVLATKTGKFDADRLDRVYTLFPALKQFWGKQAWSLSGGQKQMLAVARAIIEPRALILIDEPTKGLAPSIIAAMADAFRTIGETTTILLVEQNLAFATALGSGMAVVDDGRVAHTGLMAEFAADTALQNRLLSLSTAEETA
ncbi:MAG: ABC transporter ATP-binding protein [Maritimibacter sp.]